ncbi:T9SS type A sorting domain-containing protein [Crocinitomix catalasitica]|uniref:T9SS type A sorting domain-containing protein n=1 Tax=Crocinitomix catalasitica TaxID=184607 RepID=UPI00048392FC|nr:T9SS type A sorting domain-containing protein [Crocinitomix catalasitica]
MKNLFTLLGLSLCLTVFGQDTTVVQTFTYDSISTRRAIFPFPAELEDKQFEKVLMYYNIKCSPLTPWDSYNCGEWDYLAYSNIFRHTGLLDSVEVNTDRYLVDGDALETIAYVEDPYFHYYQRYERFITYSEEEDLDFAIGDASSTSVEPFGTSNRAQHSQLLWLNTELIAAGLTAGEIAKLRFDVDALGAEMGRLVIKMKHTPAMVLTDFDDEDWMTVYDRSTEFLATGINTLNLTYPFNFDGTSNVLVDISFENLVADAADNVLKATPVGFDAVISSNVKYGYLNIEAGDFAQLDFDGVTFGDEISISFWSNGDADLLPVNTSILEAVNNRNQRVINIHFPWSNSRIYWDAGDETGYDRIDELATAAEFEDNWVHWAFTKNKTTGDMKIYKNGSLWHSGSDKNRSIAEITKFILGSNINNDNNWAGKIDEFRIWDKELPLAVINDWKDRKLDPSHPNYADLVAYYDFDEVPAMIDRSGNNHVAMLSTPGMVQFDDVDHMPFQLSETRPDIVFVQGTFTSELDSAIVEDAVMVDPIDVLEYEVGDRRFNIASINSFYPVGNSNTYDVDGEIISTTLHEADFTTTNETLTYYEEPFEVIERFEIGRFITPYGIGFDLGPNGFTYVYDITDYQSLLAGDVDFAAHNTQELIDIKFLFIEGTPPRDVLGIEQLWDGFGSYLYKDLDNDDVLSATEVDIDPEGKMFKVRSRITGHGHNGSNNCCEWGNGVGRDHKLLVDGSLRDTWEIWQEVECGENPNISQGGTWPYAREGWCPGDIVAEHETDITAFVTPGSVASIDYDIEDVPAGDPAQGNGNYVIAMHLVTYGEANFNLDAAVIDVLNPNEWEYYSKWNPTCQNPRILIKNTGSENLTSAKISVWIGGYDNVVTIDWTGNLAFLEEEMVEIPITSDWWYDFEGLTTFSAKISSPNGGVDEYSNNDVYTSKFTPTPVINDLFYVWFKTNDAARENEIYIRNQNGEIVYSRTDLPNSTEYKDTLDLPAGCYTLELTDSDHDGIGFWASGETSGFIRLREVGGGMIETFTTDFGAYMKYSFTVDYALSVDDYEENFNLNIYPNPSKGVFNINLDNFKGENIQLEVHNRLGAIVHREVIGANNPDGYLQREIDLTDVADGMYFVKIISENNTATRPIIKQ